MTTKSGKLVPIGRHRLGVLSYDYHQCVDCKSEYPAHKHGYPTCNGTAISLCPWCRPDSEPGKCGRGN